MSMQAVITRMYMHADSHASLHPHVCCAQVNVPEVKERPNLRSYAREAKADEEAGDAANGATLTNDFVVM